MDERLNIPSVTGTDLEFEVAGPGGRSYAFVIDWHIRLLLALAWFLAGSLLYSGTSVMFEADGFEPSGFAFFVAIPSVVIYLLYHPILEILMAGRTPGKRIAGVRIVTCNGQIPGIGAHLIRNIFRLVDSLPMAYLVGFMATLFTKRHVRLGDLAAGTLLIYDAADDKAVLKDVEAIHNSKLGVQESELIQEVISRWSTLDSRMRSDLSQKLLSRLKVEIQPGSSDAELLALLKAQLGN